MGGGFFCQVEDQRLDTAWGKSLHDVNNMQRSNGWKVCLCRISADRIRRWNLFYLRRVQIPTWRLICTTPKSPFALVCIEWI
jgi:hypothetical protein